MAYHQLFTKAAGEMYDWDFGMVRKCYNRTS